MTDALKMIAAGLFAAGAYIVPIHAAAQAPVAPPGGTASAPVGHRQPTAADVPPDDSIKGARATTDRKKKGRAGTPEGVLNRGVPKVCVGCGG